jgi:hypothetical protein
VTGPTDAPLPSRWRKGTTTFGPFGRVSWTIVVVVLPIFCLVFGGIGGILFCAAWGGVVAPMALRDLWKADTLYIPAQRTATPPSTLISYDGSRIASLGEYVASQGPPPPPPPRS